MKILFKQSKEDMRCPLRNFGVERCYLKYITFADGRSFITRKRHHHTDFEIHIIERGCQAYETDEGECVLGEGEFLLIPPTRKHCALREDVNSSKFSVTFGLCEDSPWYGALPLLKGHVPDRIWEDLRCIREERESKAPLFDAMISLRVAECVLRFLRLAGGALLPDRADTVDLEADARLFLAKQYIEDNLRRPITVPELASYCAIGEKQLTRLFLSGEGIPVAEYVRRRRCVQIEHLLSDTELSLREVSETMGFQNEYYFNTFFKKHAGMTPGAYRRSVRKK